MRDSGVSVSTANLSTCSLSINNGSLIDWTWILNGDLLRCTFWYIYILLFTRNRVSAIDGGVGHCWAVTLSEEDLILILWCNKTENKLIYCECVVIRVLLYIMEGQTRSFSLKLKRGLVSEYPVFETEYGLLYGNTVCVPFIAISCSWNPLEANLTPYSRVVATTFDWVHGSVILPHTSPSTYICVTSSLTTRSCNHRDHRWLYPCSEQVMMARCVVHW